MQLLKSKKSFDPDNPMDVIERVLRMKPRSFSDKEIANYLKSLQNPFAPPGADEAISILEEERSKRKT